MVKKQRPSKKPKPKPQRRPFNMQQHWQPPTPSEFSSNVVSGFRHGFRPQNTPGQVNGYRPMMQSNRYPDQVKMAYWY